MKENLIKQKTFNFALRSLPVYRQLKKNGDFVLAGQFLRSATSIGANVEEADAAQTKREFITKMSIASKEARETFYWLRLILDGKLIESKSEYLLQDLDEIIKILTSIVKTAQINEGQKINVK